MLITASQDRSIHYYYRTASLYGRGGEAMNAMRKFAAKGNGFT
jgi:hypothetical protein